MKAILKPKLTVAEQKALDIEINRQLAENVKQMEYSLQTLVLWELHSQLGFGKKRLLRFHKKFKQSVKEMEEWYEMKTAERSEFLFREKLKEETGIDVRDIDGNMFDFEVRTTKDRKEN